MDPPGDRDPLLLLRPLRAAVAAARSNKLSGRIPVETLSAAEAEAAATPTDSDVPQFIGDDKTSKEEEDEHDATPLAPPLSSSSADEDVRDSRVESRVESAKSLEHDAAPPPPPPPAAKTESRKASLSGRGNIEGKRG